MPALGREVVQDSLEISKQFQKNSDLGISSGRWIYGMNVGTILIEACLAPESKTWIPDYEDCGRGLPARNLEHQ